MSVGGSQVQGNVVAHVRCIDTSAALQQRLHELGMPLLGNPVKGAEAMIVTASINGESERERKKRETHTHIVSFIVLVQVVYTTQE